MNPKVGIELIERSRIRSVEKTGTVSVEEVKVDIWFERRERTVNAGREVSGARAERCVKLFEERLSVVRTVVGRGIVRLV